MQKPQFSFIVPVYKVREDYLRECVRSIENQTFSDWELLLSDDGGADSCAARCDAFAAEDPRILVLHAPNGGAAAARNRALCAAAGEWIWFTDADDRIEANACAVLTARVAEFPGCDFLHFLAVRDYADKSCLMRVDGVPFGKLLCADEETRLLLIRRTLQAPGFFRDALVHDHDYFIWDKLFHRDFLTGNGIEFPIGIRLSEDMLFFLRCLRHWKRTVYLDDALYHNRQNAQSVTNSFAPRADEDRLALYALLQSAEREAEREFPEEAKALLQRDLDSFIAVSASLVLPSKFYHEQWRENSRARTARAFLRREPVRSALRRVRPNELTPLNAVRIVLLRFGFCGVFAALYKRKHRKFRRVLMD